MSTHPSVRRTRLQLMLLEARIAPAGTPLTAFGADFGAPPRVRVVNQDTGEVRFDFLAFHLRFRGGVRVAVGDMTGDGQDDIVAATGPGVRPFVKVFDGTTGKLVRGFAATAAMPPNVSAALIGSQLRITQAATPFRGGATIAVGDINDDGRSEIIVGFDAGAPSVINIFNGLSGKRIGQHTIDNAKPRTGLRVAAGDLDGDGRPEIITAPAKGSSLTVNVLDPLTRRKELTLHPAAMTSNGGLFVASADVDGDGQAEILLAGDQDDSISIHRGRTGELRNTVFTDLPAGGLRLAGALVSKDGEADLIVGSSTTGEWSAYSGTGSRLGHDTLDDFPTGVWVASSPQQIEINRHAAQVILDWNSAALNAIRSEKTSPPIVTRALAILQTAVFDAVAGLTGRFKPYLDHAAAPVGASVPAAVAQAAYTSLVALFPSQQTRLDLTLASALNSIADGTSKADGIAFGQSVAQAILAARADDGSTSSRQYTPGTDPGDWQPTPPANVSALLPGWGDVAPFGIKNLGEFLPPGPPALTSQEWADEFNEVKRLGSKTSVDRTVDQTQIAQFWADGAGTFTPPGHWNAIAGQLAQQDGLSLLQTARLFAHLAIAEADAAIACWKAKFTYGFWRPITAIHAADTDGNAQTTADPNWEPLLTTPPFPDYTSGHSTFSGAASTVLAAYFGDNRAFTTQSDDGAISRYFTSFAEAAEEAGRSRIYGGIHYQSANEDAIAAGRKIAAHVLAHVLKSK